MTLKPASMALALALALSGCTLAPSYEQPPSPVPDQFREGADATQVTLPGWRDFFTEQELQQLIQTALANNRDLRLAMLDVEELRAQYRIQRADLFPNIGLNGTGTRQRVPGDLNNTGESQVQSQYGANVGISAYELDLFGRVRSLKDAALQNYLASEEAQRSAHITLVSEVANAYLSLVADRENLRISEETMEAYRASLDLTQRRFDLGVGSELELRQAQTALETARANRARFARLVAQDRNALATLVGAPLPPLPSDNLEESGLVDLSEVPSGLSSNVLLARPDIIRAEHLLRAANANIGAARAAFFPSISLTGTFGTSSAELDGLFESGSRSWSFSPSISLPIFTGGRNRASLDVAAVRRDQSVATYEQTIQTAFQEVSDALVSRETLLEQEIAQQALVDATRRSLELSQQRYELGADDYLAVLDAQRSLLTARQELVSITLSKLANQITLYRALGGGWLEDQATVINTAPEQEDSDTSSTQG
ncbi:Efflux transporter, outer membrane factor lipoprotein, NodT family [Alloalcanivorax dieselolei B5]|uniref:Efflux transporter, outer membrane factor lipoprotein, NodT family n=1 Tax=Alcanivorax dieselolei (strain DSM 16502 / CGMCC 1.3690 / MCCC 1A00001 / B-5) TaxID=930169 RepID=K0CEB7_ALCDB|nr:efflux transporter outer membrane subunit [Alloalcanivorax dieselolei]AFT69926.1 Efflux transporter, outer membrane factor lipoprotein, NodT family [Alloalcanivorax dieselolei B5]GGJ87980.1 outer membrane protein OprM [Alloalcanivorax dieselolei]